MAEEAPHVYYSSFFYRYIWPNFYPNNYNQRPSVNIPQDIDRHFHVATSPLSETVVKLVLLVISQLLIPSTARVIVRLWPSLRENSVRVMLMLGWYAVMASMVIGARGEPEGAWMKGFETGWVEGGGVEQELRSWWRMKREG
jgi:hypothetical protein